MMEFQIYRIGDYDEWTLSIKKPFEIFHRDTLDELLEIVKDKLQHIKEGE